MAVENKPLVYMRYAIGEIVLVVIGILIALQINNWNEDRIQENRRKEVTKALTLELNDVLSYTQKQVNMMDDRIESFSKILNDWENLNPETLHIDKLRRYYWYIHTASLLKFNPQIGYYSSLINSGEIRLIPDSLVADLNYVYEKHRIDVVTYVNQEVDLHVLIAEVVAKNHSEVFLSGSADSHYMNTLDTTTVIKFINAVKYDGELKSLIFRNLGIIKMKRFLLSTRVIPDLNNLIEDFKPD